MKSLRAWCVVLGLGMSPMAWAFHCTEDMAKIDAAMAQNPKLSAAELAEVKRLRQQGELLHKAGKHQESVNTLGQAMKLLRL